MKVLETRNSVRICKNGSNYVVVTRTSSLTTNCKKRANKYFENLSK